MPIWRAQCTFLRDTAFPRDRMAINPVFNDTGLGSDPNGLAGDLADALVAWHGNTFETIVKLYDVQGTPPVFPAGEAVRNAGVTLPSSMPREVALCLSFYGERNLPRTRGRLYIPACVPSGFNVPGVRPSAAQRQKVADLVPIFAGLGGADVDWNIWSPTAQDATHVENWFVDDEWDTVRSRGLRGETRLTGTTPG